MWFLDTPCCVPDNMFWGPVERPLQQVSNNRLAAAGLPLVRHPSASLMAPHSLERPEAEEGIPPLPVVDTG